MDSPLKYDEAVKKEFGIDKIDIEPALVLGWARNQYEEIKKLLIRERIDLLLAETQAKSDIEAFAAEAKSKVAAHRNNIKGIVASINTLKTFVDELSAKLTK